jgi:hypothetical protein
MTKTILLSAFTGLFFIAFSGCEKMLDNLVEQTVTTDYTEIDLTVNPGASGTYTETLDVVYPNLDSMLQDEGFDLGNVNSIKISDARVEVVGEGNLDPFGSFLTTLEATGITAVTIAEATAVPTGITEILLAKKGAELSDFLKSDHYTIKVKAVLDQTLQVQMKLVVKVRYEIKVGL